MTDLAISIINYKTKELTAQCIKSIINKKWSINYEIWLIDNASNDGSSEYFKKEFPNIHIIDSPSNGGFAKGQNLALKQIKTKYVLVLNSDTKVTDNSLDDMVKFMDDNPKVGVSSCKVINFEGKLQPNGGNLPFGMALLGWLFNLESIGLTKPAFHRDDKGYYANVHKVGWVSGSFMMIQKEVLDKIGFFNEDYFMYFEDVEFCYRTQKAGFEVWINPEVKIEHLSGGSLDDPKFRQWSGELKGLIRFYRQQFGVLVIFLQILIFISTFLRIIAFTLIGKLDYAKTYAKVIFTI